LKQVNPGDYYDLLLHANAYFTSQRFEEALVAYNLLLRHQNGSPNDAFVYIHKSLTLMCLDRPEEAAETIDEGIAYLPASLMLHEFRTQLLLKTRRLAKLPEAYDSILRLRPQAASAHIFKSLALFLLDRAQEAQTGQEHLLTVLPNAIKPPPFQGELREQLEQYEVLIGEAVARDGQSPTAWYYRGEVLRLLYSAEGKLEAAEEAFDEALRLDPRAALAHNGRGNVLFAQQRYREAAASYARAVALRPAVQGFRENRSRAVRAAEGSAPGKKNRKKGRGDRRRGGWGGLPQAGRVSPLPSPEEFAQLLEDGRFEEALAVVEQKIARAVTAGQRESALLLKATILGHLAGRTEEALSTYREILRHNPSSLEVWQDVIVLLLEDRRFEEALEACERAISLDESNSELHARKGGILALLGRTEEALISQERARALDPENAVTWINLAAEISAQGRFEEALPVFDGAIERARGQHAPFAMLGKAYALLGLGRSKEALHLLADAVGIERERRQSPADDEQEAVYDQVGGDLLARLYFTQGEASFALKDYTNALSCYDLALSLGPNQEAETRREHALVELHLAAGTRRQDGHEEGAEERVPRRKGIGFSAAFALLLAVGVMVLFQGNVDPVLRPALRTLHQPLELLTILLYAVTCWWGWRAGKMGAVTQYSADTDGNLGAEAGPAAASPTGARATWLPRLYGAARYGWVYLLMLLPLIVAAQLYDYLSLGDPLAGAIVRACFPLLLLHTGAVSILFLTTASVATRAG
jgi:tetratricopeptide (TPR) repeat protein